MNSMISLGKAIPRKTDWGVGENLVQYHKIFIVRFSLSLKMIIVARDFYSTFTWDPKGIQTDLRFHFGVKFHFGLR